MGLSTHIETNANAKANAKAKAKNNYKALDTCTFKNNNFELAKQILDIALKNILNQALELDTTKTEPIQRTTETQDMTLGTKHKDISNTLTQDNDARIKRLGKNALSQAQNRKLASSHTT